MRTTSLSSTKVQAQRKAIAGILLLLMMCCFSCEDFLDIGPPKNQTVGETAYKDDAVATSAILGIYTQMSNAYATNAQNNITVLLGCSADERYSYLSNDFLTNSILPANPGLKANLWEPGYKYVYYANAFLEGISKSSNVISKARLEGEARFLRAFSFFYLTSLFGDVPLPTTTSYKVNNTIPKTPQEEVYARMIKDLEEAEKLLPEDYSAYKVTVNGTSVDERVRVNKAAATALLARVHLYAGHWDASHWAQAEAAATAVIDNSFYRLIELNEPGGIFTANSNEAIWQLQPVNGARLGSSFSTNASFPLLRNELINAFEANDKRKTQWVGSTFVENETRYFSLKYRPGDNTKEYLMVLRLAEQYLIRAEARARQDKFDNAIADVNKIRKRAGLGALPDTIDKDGLMLAIEQERRIELMAEWGHRWLDLKRTNRADQVLTTLKSLDWQSTDVLYPIPQSEIDNNPNLNPQNEGY